MKHSMTYRVLYTVFYIILYPIVVVGFVGYILINSIISFPKSIIKTIRKMNTEVVEQ